MAKYLIKLSTLTKCKTLIDKRASLVASLAHFNKNKNCGNYTYYGNNVTCYTTGGSTAFSISVTQDEYKEILETMIAKIDVELDKLGVEVDG